ncbi:hypothetical protein EV359DRAFT_66044 [Lentinula novae-zelandiae]|nr:hypothetical protein EV359DRAFT_66044 [Lentinula novae-zelandiae]
MPEQREPRAMERQLKESVSEAQKQGSSFSTVQALWCDSTAQEAKLSKAGSRFSQHLVDRIDASCPFHRGQKDNQTPLYPPQLAITKKNPHPEPITTLGLCGPQSIHSTARALILELGPINLMLAFLTHCNVNLYPRIYWEASICMLTSKERKFSVALALEFQDHFLAFLSLDNLFQPTYYKSLDPPPVEATIPDPFLHHASFLSMVAAEIDKLLDGRRLEDRLAIKIVRDMKSLHGAGVYTSLEIFTMAGISPFLSAYEVFRCPSRTARLLDAYWCFCKRMHSEELWTELLRPAIHNGVLAPTQDQRLKYATWLCVYAKDSALCTVREANLIDDYTKTLQHVYATKLPFFRNGDGAEKLFDVFEPGRIQAALERTELNLAHLIFPHSLCPIVGHHKPFTSCDPITELFRQRGLLCSDTHLRDDIYQPMLWIITYSWLLQKRQYGMLIQSNSGQFTWPASKFEQIIGEKRESLLFRNIISKNTTDVAIGPLEYCGSGRMVKTTQGKKVDFQICYVSTAKATGQ